MVGETYPEDAEGKLKPMTAAQPPDVDPGLYALLVTMLSPEQAALLLRNELPGLRNHEHAAVAAARTRAEAEKDAKIEAARETAGKRAAAASRGVAVLETRVASAETAMSAGQEATVAFLRANLATARTAAAAEVAAASVELEAQTAAAIDEAEAVVAAAVERCRSESRNYLLAKARVKITAASAILAPGACAAASPPAPLRRASVFSAAAAAVRSLATAAVEASLM
ncbi:hypothetical protein HYH03_017899 [Edaphochlamys debaryana]|uniref:Uncharacterized protein n=1 Tax=Edaphochlamys debaryana TaxID=47281 RepID=A0A835XEV7_9CHLO|nr:hypothetical protein HYH03_017899 [Edaphochlamys debaryana]|eukprot:KAG2483242.1 hypothetical protein HYH03_017899 [Edaphochlamys debaryana]